MYGWRISCAACMNGSDASTRCTPSGIALTAAAVILGVAFVARSLILNDTARRLFDEQFATATAGADLTVRTATAFDSGMGVEVERDPLAQAVLERVRGVDGVDLAIPVARGSARIQRGDIDLGGVQLSTWVPDPIGPHPLLEGAEPTAADEVVIDRAAARALGLAIGDEVVLAGEATATARVVGLVGFGDSDGPPIGMVALTTLDGAQQILGLGDACSEILVVSSVGAAALQPQLAA